MCFPPTISGLRWKRGALSAFGRTLTYVESLILSGAADAGRLRWGMALTRSEGEVIDFDHRMEFASAASESVLPFARARQDFAGAYVDQAAGGRLVLLFTAPDEELQEEIEVSAPPWVTRSTEPRSASTVASSQTTSRVTTSALGTGEPGTYTAVTRKGCLSKVVTADRRCTSARERRRLASA